MDQLSTTNLRGATVVNADLRDIWVREADLRGAHIRGAELSNAEIDGEIDGLRVNGVEIAELVEAELDRRHPERAALHARDAGSFRSGWAELQARWKPTLERVAGMPAGAAAISVADEWSFSQTLRHLVFATDVWLNDAILDEDQPYHRWGEPFSRWRETARTVGIEPGADPSYAEVLRMRADRVQQVTDFVTAVTDEQLDQSGCRPVFVPHSFTVRDCLKIIMNEEWQHHRFAVRDLDAINTPGS